MAVTDQLQSDANSALKAGDRERAGALRVVLSELQKAAKEGNADEVAVLQRERKLREGGRDELAGAAEREVEMIEAYLPEQVSDEELNAIVGDAVAETGATSPKDMGRVMSIVMPKVQGRADGRRVSAAAKELLTG
jgi:uncharacterized protein YqeY